MDNTTIVHLTATEASLGQQLHSLRGTLSKHTQSVQTSITKYTKFQEVLDLLRTFLRVTEAELAEDDPNASADEEDLRKRMNAFRDLLGEFQRKQSHLDKLNSLGYRLPLSKEDSAAVKDVNSRWHAALANINERYRNVQSHLLLQQDFHEKCAEWGRFVAQVERDLASNIAGSYEALLDQQKAFEVRIFTIG